MVDCYRVLGLNRRFILMGKVRVLGVVRALDSLERLLIVRGIGLSLFYCTVNIVLVVIRVSNEEVWVKFTCLQ